MLSNDWGETGVRAVHVSHPTKAVFSSKELECCVRHMYGLVTQSELGSKLLLQASIYLGMEDLQVIVVA